MRERRTAELLTIGDELLKGSTANTNAEFLGRELLLLGFEVKTQVSCRDSIAAIKERLGECVLRADLVIVTGGLGPTPDDVTREAVAEFFSAPLIFSKSQFAQIQKHYRQRKRKVPPIVRREAMFPRNAAPLRNEFGIALGFSIKAGRSLVVVLPGVPYELERMFHSRVRPLIHSEFRDRAPAAHLVVKTVGLSEPRVMQRLGRDFFNSEFDFGIYPGAGEVALRIQADSPALIRRLRSKIRKRLGESVYAYEEKSLAQSVGEILRRKKKTLASAESCTGGLFASEITKIPGASRYFLGGIVAYHDELKRKALGIPQALLRSHGAVSAAVARRMAVNIQKKMSASYGVGITGIAGPEGGSARKPVGLVYLALASGKKSRVWKEIFWGDRGQIQLKAVKKALEYLWCEIR